MIVYCLLTIGFCLTQQVMTGHAESAKLPEEPKQEDSEKKGEKKQGGRFLPIPIFLTEPAFGYGLGVALGYIHPAKEDTETQEEPSLHTLGSASSERSSQKPPPTITGVAGGYTAKDTWGAAVAHSTSWRKDTIRYAGGAGVRYFMMRDLGLWLGVDVAQGPEDWYAYITVGQAW